MIFSVSDGNHILQPQNKIATKGQNLFFKLLENRQEELIRQYDGLNDDEKFQRANSLSSLFVDVLMNGDQVSFKILLGTGGGLMNVEELKNVKKDLEIAKKRKALGEYRTFLLLDLLPQSNRRADAIIVNNDYGIELYDFSEGVVAEKLKNYQGDIKDLSEKEKKQLRRKDKQQERIVSFHNKISMDSESLEDIIMDSDITRVRYYCAKPKLFDFNNAYQQFLNGKRKRVYIPNSVCFLTKKDEYKQSDLFVFPLKKNIDSPHYTTEGRFIDNDYIKDIYQNNTNIVFSKYYFFIFFGQYTCFEVLLKKKIETSKLTNHVKLIVNGKTRGVMIKDSRSDKSFPLTYQLLFKHAFMNISLKSWCEYLSAICNQTFNDKKFNQDSFYVDEIKKGCYFFDV